MRRLWWLVLALVLVGGGVALVLSNPAGPTDFGWFAYTPLTEPPDWAISWDGGTSTLGPALIVSRWQLVGGALVALGVVVVGSGLAYRLGRRRGAASTA